MSVTPSVTRRSIQLVEILDALFPNSIPLHKKWDLVVAVKHWHQRRGIER